ncbi:MAG TPA: hypothetical protein VI258_10670, partial [Rhodanobacteraceae bacterium]
MITRVFQQLPVETAIISRATHSDYAATGVHQFTGGDVMQASSSVISQGVLTTLRVLMLCVSLPCSTLAAHAIGPAAGAVVSPQLPDRVAGNQCAICHIRLVWTRSATTHVDEWVTSKHATYGVGCEQCHGGDPAATSGAAAH